MVEGVGVMEQNSPSPRVVLPSFTCHLRFVVVLKFELGPARADADRTDY